MTPSTTEAPARSAPHPSVRMRRLTARKAARRKRNRASQREEWMRFLRGPGRSDRSRFKERMREKGMDEVMLDHEQGRELGRIARRLYRQEQAAAARRAAEQPRQAPRKSTPRLRETYRWARKKEERGARMAVVLKRLRLKHGLSRSEADRLRWEAAQQQERAA